MEEEKDLVGELTEAQISRRQLIKRAGVGAGALSLPAFLAACGGDDDEEAAATTTATAAQTGAKKTFYSVTHGESGNVFWAIYRNGIRDGSKLYNVEVKDLPLEQFSVAGYVDLLNQAISAKPDGIYATIVDQAAVDQPLRDAIARSASGSPTSSTSAATRRPGAGSRRNVSSRTRPTSSTRSASSTSRGTPGSRRDAVATQRS
jgi:hypothetical protein